MMNANSETTIHGRILVIDDEAAILIMLKRLLGAAGYEAQTAPSGREGLALFQQGGWNAVLVDRTMPQMNGEEVAAEIKRLAPRTPVILITGFPGAVTRRDLFYAILGKPFRSPELLSHLADCLRQQDESHDEPAEGSVEKRHSTNPGAGGCQMHESAPSSLPAWRILLEKPCAGSA